MSYFEKINSNKILDGEFSEKEYEHISYIYNFYEYMNAYIKIFIPTNQKISVNLFIEVIKNLFIRNSNK